MTKDEKAIQWLKIALFLVAMAYILWRIETIVGLGTDLRESLREYRVLTSSDGYSVAPTDEADFETAVLELTRVSIEVIGTKMLYYLYSKNMPDRIFIATSDISPELSISKPPDIVKVGYMKTREPLVQLITFNNTKLNIRTTTEQQPPT